MRADEIIDRRRLRRKLTFWRVATVVVAAIAIGAALSWLYRDDYGAAAANQIAKISVEGTITNDQDMLDLLDRVAGTPAVKGVILAVNSPGGTTVGGEAIYEEVRRLAAKKPVVTEVGTLAASAGYMIASAGDHIVAHKTSIVGSIGVLVEFPDVTGLMDKIGVKLEEVKSSPLKAEPSPFNQTTDEERAMVRKLIMDSYDWFVGIVAERRSLSRADVLTLADGSIFTGRQAVANKLIDEVGGEREAVAWLATKGVDPALKVVEWKPQRSDGGFPFYRSLMGAAASALGLPNAAGEAMLGIFGRRMFLDGLQSLWHAGGEHVSN